MTVNSCLDVDQYPLPRPEDLFATLAGGKFFSTLRPDRRAQVKAQQARQKADHDGKSPDREFTPGDLVMAQNYRSGSAWIPAIVAVKLGPRMYLEIRDKLLWRRHIDQLKKRDPPPVAISQPVAREPSLPVQDDDTSVQEQVDERSDPANEAPTNIEQETRRYPQWERRTPSYFEPEH